MKIWYGYGSEHSMNLVMIGEFKDARDAADVSRMIQKIKEQVEADGEAGVIETGRHSERFSPGMLKLLIDLNFVEVGLDELQQFAYEVSFVVVDNTVVVETDESDVSAFLKIMLNKGARIEVFSGHDYPGTEYGRGV